MGPTILDRFFILVFFGGVHHLIGAKTPTIVRGGGLRDVVFASSCYLELESHGLIDDSW